MGTLCQWPINQLYCQRVANTFSNLPGYYQERPVTGHTPQGIGYPLELVEEKELTTI
jgi:hypothetical protein